MLKRRQCPNCGKRWRYRNPVASVLIGHPNICSVHCRIEYLLNLLEKEIENLHDLII